jgi:hypothetical protein
VPERKRVKMSSTIDEARRLIEWSRVLCATAADLTRESKAIKVSILKSIEQNREVLRLR